MQILGVSLWYEYGIDQQCIYIDFCFISSRILIIFDHLNIWK